MRTRAFAIGAGNMNSGIRLMWVSQMLVEQQGIGQSLLVTCIALSFEHGHLVEEVLASLLIRHGGNCLLQLSRNLLLSLTEIILELLEDRALGVCVALEVVAVTELFNGRLLFLRQGFGNIYADVDDEVAIATSVTLYGR